MNQRGHSGRNWGRLEVACWSLPLVVFALLGCGRQPPSPEAPAPPPPPPSPALTVVLLPDADGAVGSIEVANASGSQTVSEERQAVRVQYVGREPEPPVVLDESEISQIFGEALTAQPEAPVRFTLHFTSGTTLTQESLQLIPEIVQTIQRRASVDTSIVGHSDSSGDKAVNFRVSRNRAQAVADLLVAAGADPSVLDIDSHGEENLLVPTPDGVVEPRNRRVEVTVR